MKPTTPSVLTVNGGSSSIHFALFEADGAPRRILEGRVEGLGLGQGSFKAKGLQPSDNFSQPVVASKHTIAKTVCRVLGFTAKKEEYYEKAKHWHSVWSHSECSPDTRTPRPN